MLILCLEDHKQGVDRYSNNVNLSDSKFDNLPFGNQSLETRKLSPSGSSTNNIQSDSQKEFDVTDDEKIDMLFEDEQEDEQEDTQGVKKSMFSQHTSEVYKTGYSDSHSLEISPQIIDEVPQVSNLEDKTKQKWENYAVGMDKISEMDENLDSNTNTAQIDTCRGQSKTGEALIKEIDFIDS